MLVQTKGEIATCSCIGDIQKHEKFKKLSKETRIQKLQEAYDKYGVRSNEFFTQVKPFIMWTIYKHLRGMSADLFMEDLINSVYENLIIVFDGGRTSHYNKTVYQEKKYGTKHYYQTYKNIGEFVMYHTWSAVSKYRSKYFKKQVEHEDNSQDISEKISFTDFEEKHNLKYELTEPDYTRFFTKFEISASLAQHLKMLKETKPKNNILYNFMLWKEQE